MIQKIIKETSTPSHDDLVQFSDFHRVALEAGAYTLEATQTINEESLELDTYDFSVLAEQYQLAPSAIRSVFPPKGSQGDYWHTMPHLVLERSTLPWERTALKDGISPDTDCPWLALLVLHPSDNTNVTIEDVTGADLKSKEIEKAAFIQVSKNHLPTVKELDALTHIRRRLAFLGEYHSHQLAVDSPVIKELKQAHTHEIPADDGSLPEGVNQAWLIEDLDTKEKYEVLQYKEGNTPFKVYHVAHEAATILANRLPKPGQQNIIHLVSMEGVYSGQDFTNTTDDKLKLVSLYQWSFFCEEENKTFKELLAKLDASDWHLKLAEENESTDSKTASFSLEKYTQNGFVPLRHRFREGSKSISWYHGPLMPIEGGLNLTNLSTETIMQADQLVLYDKINGLFDVSYAAAWELGRMLTLQNTKIAIALYNWKRQQARQQNVLRHLTDASYLLAIDGNLPELNDQPPKAVEQWMEELSLLTHLPFNYLVPDAALLPPESFRFFKLDATWISCLLQGAYSIGSSLASEVEKDKKLFNKHIAKNDAVYTGFLIRSEVIAGWPDLKMTAYEAIPVSIKGTTKVQIPNRTVAQVLLPIRKAVLSKEVLLVLFEGDIKAVDFFMPPETLHFGFETPVDPNLNANEVLSNRPDLLIKRKRNVGTGVVDEANAVSVLYHDKDKRIIKIEALMQAFAPPEPATVHAGTLAVQLILGDDLIRITC